MDLAERSQVPSDEADNRQLTMAREEGAAYQRSLDYMVEEVAHTGAKKRAGDYIVGFAQERAEGMYRPDAHGELVWCEPTDKNCHIEISVCDAADHRFIPSLEVKAALVAGQVAIGPFPVPFLWHPGLYHYGANIKVPHDGKYTLLVEIAPPQFPRHDKTNGRRYAKPVHVEFHAVYIKTGRE